MQPGSSFSSSSWSQPGILSSAIPPSPKWSPTGPASPSTSTPATPPPARAQLAPSSHDTTSVTGTVTTHGTCPSDASLKPDGGSSPSDRHDFGTLSTGAPFEVSLWSFSPSHQPPSSATSTMGSSRGWGMASMATPPSPLISPTPSVTSDRRLLPRPRTHRRRRALVFSLDRHRRARLVTGETRVRLTLGHARCTAPGLDLVPGDLRSGTKPPLDIDILSTSLPRVGTQLTTLRRTHRNRPKGVHSTAGRSLLYPATRRSNLDRLARAIISGGGTAPPATTSSLPHGSRLGGTQPNPQPLVTHLGHSSSA